METYPVLTDEQQEWLTKWGFSDVYLFTSHGSSRECIEADVDNLYSILMKFDLQEADKLWQQAQDCFDSLLELDEEQLTDEVRGRISEEFQALYEILFAFEDAIGNHTPEGLGFGISEHGADYGFWTYDE